MKNNTNKLLGLFSLIFTQSCFSMLFSLVVRPEVCSANVVAYYTFDDHVQDATANQFDGVAVNMNYSSDVPAEIDSVSSALWQDELVHRYVDLPVIRGLGPEFTVTCWLKTSNSRPGWLPVLVNNVPQSTHMALTVNTWASTDQRIVFDTRDDDLNVANAITVTNAFSLGIWHHVAWVRDGSAVSVYVDGTAVSMSDSSVQDDFPIDLSLRVGQNKQASLNNWGGLIDDLAIWDEALSSSVIANLASGTISPAAYMTEPARVVAYYSFDDSTGNDASGLDNHAVLNNVSCEATDVPPGLGGKALKFSDDTDSIARFVEIPPLQELNTRFTFTCWAKTPTIVSNDDWRFLLANNVPWKPGFGLYVNDAGSSNKRVRFDSMNAGLDDNDAFSVTNIWTDGLWHHLAFTRDGEKISFFIDGDRVSMQDDSIFSDFPTQLSMRLGHNFRGNGGNHWVGSLDDVAFWNGVLSDNIINNLASGKDSPANHIVPSWWMNHFVGDMRPFYRYSKVVGNWLEGGSGLIKVSTNWTSAGDFPYQVRNFTREIPFCDDVFLGKILGGWHLSASSGEATLIDGIPWTTNTIPQFDVAQRNTNGVIEYHWDLLTNRINSYFDKGYTNTVTIGLGNICWGFPDNPSEVVVTSSVEVQKWGQVAPPSDLTEWHAFMTNMCVMLADTYGTNNVNQWKFRSISGFAEFRGTVEEAFDMYDLTADAIRSVLPDAKIGSFEYGGGLEQTANYFNFPGGALGLYKYCGSNNIPCDFGSRQLYLGVSKLEERIAETVSDREVISEALGYSVPIEIPQYGLLFNEDGLNCSDDPGEYGAAVHCHTLMGIYADGGMDDLIMHWPNQAEVIPGKGYLMGSMYWLFSIFDYLLGGDVYELSHPTNSPEGTMYRTYAVVKGQTKYITLSAHHPDRSETTQRDITIQIPREMMSIAEDSILQYVNTTSNLYDVIHADLVANDLLEGAWEGTDGLGQVVHMSGTAGREYVADHWDYYAKVLSDSLTLKPFAGIGSVSSVVSNGYYTVTVSNVSPHSVTVITVNDQ